MQNRWQVTLGLFLAVAWTIELGSQTSSSVPDHNSSKAAQTKESQGYFSQLQEFQKLGRAAYSSEEAREKAGSCPEARTTYDINVCLGKEVDKTETNYKIYTDALRSVEGLASPDASGAGGPTGKALTPEERLKAFDKVESAWRVYYEAQCSDAYDAYQGGDIAPSIDLTCRFRLMRDRMHELESIFDFMH
jgi:uncharacterized protein YecT (DUF1311 family)